jgi:hypothetical protein
MQSARLFMLIVTCLSLISAHDSFADDNLDITVGLGYDKMTQGYYLSLIDTLTLDEDSILTLKQDSDELDAYRLRAAIEWNKSSDAGNSLRIGNSFTGSGDDLRNNLEATCKYRSLEIRNELDTRAVLDTNSSSRNGYVSNVAEFRFKPELSDGLFFVARDAFEIVRYDGSGEFIFDYNYNKFSVGFERQFGWTDMFSVTYRNDIRSVRDSTRLDLTRHRFRMQLDWSPTFSTTIRLDNELSRILAEKESDLDDSWEDYLEIELYAIFSESWRASLRNQFEYVAYLRNSRRPDRYWTNSRFSRNRPWLSSGHGDQTSSSRTMSSRMWSMASIYPSALDYGSAHPTGSATAIIQMNQTCSTPTTHSINLISSATSRYTTASGSML